MVFGFVCHSLSGTPCRVLYSAIFGDDLHPRNSQVAILPPSLLFSPLSSPLRQVTNLDSLRKSRKEQIMKVACRVQAEYGFRVAAKDVANGYILEGGRDRDE